ncbi:uncharacterized protein MELLADRAFT_102759 [Melampsora larici-populina 98AG31]|uniref:Uncharacterized protein n=1 Tax=Melampsora larici-populina (strain 98AG31 / pathotype 3-4-7) TaxID=747676 RepID=F4R9A3_MELLP|nr:uncharacterized protein MELLADRAFT_102759 [Melampsora larici-populina 98AG31]EGG11190.1 hypothetical protein MELLADRAFT_102759 [Melampsora larici-populina 98AG31]
MEDRADESVAHEVTLHDIHNNTLQRIQKAEDKPGVHELTLRVWLKAGESLNIPVVAFDFPRYALIESRALELHASDCLSSWDLKLQVLRSGSWDWYLTDAAIPFTYAFDTTELLIRAYGVPVESCVGMETAINSLKIGGESVSGPFQRPLRPDPLNLKVVLPRKRLSLNPSTSTPTTTQPVIDSSDSEIFNYRNLKRKKEAKDSQHSPLAQENKS